jgi:hypothetical protein
MSKYYFILFFVITTFSFSQKTLDLTYISILGKEKTFQFFNNREFSYRLKGELLYRTHTLTNMQDSFLVFDNDEIVKLNQIRSVRIKGGRIAGWLYKAGFVFLALDITGNLIQSKTPIVKEQALMVTGVFVLAGAIVNYFQDKHIRITKNCVFRVIDHDFPNLATHGSDSN